MLLVIFGAGASYDSDPRYPPLADVDNLPPQERVDYSQADRLRPPLTRDLFSNRNRQLLEKYPRCVALVARLRRSMSSGTALEEALESIREEAETIPRLAGELIVLRYYLRDVLALGVESWFKVTQGATNYADLLSIIDDWCHDKGSDITLVTFNYDHLLLSACYSVVGSLDGPLWREHYGLFHVHGFVGWSREVTFDASLAASTGEQADWASRKAWFELEGSVRDYLPSIASQLQFTDRFLTHEEIPDPVPEGTGFIPAIAVPTVRKDNFECSSGQLDRLRDRFPRVTRLLVVGWRGMEDHFLQMWSESIDATRGLPPVVLEGIQIVDAHPDGAQSVVERLREVAGIVSVDTRVSTAGFTGFLAEGALQSFLAS